MSDEDAIWSALAHPVRRYILELLDSGAESAGDLARSAAATFGISTSRASQHLQVLAHANLVSVTGDATWRHYAINDGAAREAAAWLEGIRLAP